MPTFSKTSLDRLASCHPDLQRVLKEAIKHVDFTVLEGVRPKARQDALFAKGLSKVKWPNGKHNRMKRAQGGGYDYDRSDAVDVAPYPVDWKNLQRFRDLAKFVMGIAAGMGVTLRWGGTWSTNPFDKEARFYDAVHFEMVHPD